MKAVAVVEVETALRSAIGGIGGIAPSRRPDLARLGLRAVCAGALVSCLSAVWAGLIFQLFRS